MRKRRAIISFALASAMIFTALAPMNVSAEENGITEKEVTAYIYNNENTETIKCLFKNDLPGTAYISAEDYLNHAYKSPVTEEKNSDGTYTITNEKGSIIVDTKKDTIYSDFFDAFLGAPANADGTELDIPYAQPTQVTEGDTKSLLLNFGAYDIDILESEDKVYLPASVISSLFSPTYNSAVYLKDNIYFVHMSDLVTGGTYIDKLFSYEKTTRTKEEAGQEYNELCFLMDKVYGRPKRAAVSELMTEKGFDATLSEYSDKTREAKELLKSESLSDMLIGLAIIDDAFWDGGHTSLFLGAYNQIASTYSDSALTASLRENPEIQEIVPAMTKSMNSQNKSQQLGELRAAKYQDYELIMAWEDATKSALYRKDDTVIFAFDQYLNEAVYNFKWSLDYAAENGIKRFVIDDSCNQGGNAAVVGYMCTMLKNRDKNNNTFFMNTENRLTGNVQKDSYLIDLDLNGEINDLDKQVYYDFEYAVVTSSASYSSGNYFPCIAKNAGIPILGERSGGGSCFMCPVFGPENMFYSMSVYQCMLDQNLNDVDNGAELDYELIKKETAEDGNEYIDYLGLYDIDGYKGLIDEYYEGKDNKALPVYRLYNETTGEHFYTASEAEKKIIEAAGWKYESIGWYAPETSNSPVYRLFDPNSGNHHYTMNSKEKDVLVSTGWTYEGICWYSDDNLTTPLYRQYNPYAAFGSHFFTADKNEQSVLTEAGWESEGIGWYGF